MSSGEEAAATTPPPGQPALAGLPGPEVIREFADRGALWLFEAPENVKDLLRLVHPDLARDLDFTRAIRVNRSFIPPDLRKLESDVIYQLPYRPSAGAAADRRAAEVWIYMLLENQSRRDRLMALRLLRYMCELWEAQCRDLEGQGIPPGQWRLSPVVPLVFYTGEGTWAAPRLSDLIVAPAALHPFIPNWETLFLPLHETAPEAVTALNAPIGWALRVMREEKAPLETLERVLQEAMAALEALPADQEAQWMRVTCFFLLLAFHRRGRDEYNLLRESIEEQARRSRFRRHDKVAIMVQTMAEYLEQQGEARAEVRTMREAVETALVVRFGSLPSGVRAGLWGADMDALRVWLRAALTAASLEEVGIPGASRDRS